MSATSGTIVTTRTPAIPIARLLWLGAFVLSLVFLYLPRGTLPGWALAIPPAGRIPLQGWISKAMAWLVNDAGFGLFTFRELTRFIAAILQVPFTIATSLFATGLLSGAGSAAIQILPPLPWLAVLAAAAILAWQAGGAGLATLAGCAFLYLA